MNHQVAQTEHIRTHKIAVLRLRYTHTHGEYNFIFNGINASNATQPCFGYWLCQYIFIVFLLFFIQHGFEIMPGHMTMYCVHTNNNYQLKYVWNSVRVRGRSSQWSSMRTKCINFICIFGPLCVHNAIIFFCVDLSDRMKQRESIEEAK